MTNRRLEFLALAILLGVFALYVRALFNFFFLDDFDLLAIRLPQTLAEWLAPFDLRWQSVYGWYRPLPQFYYVALMRPLAGANPLPYFAASLGLLLLNVALSVRVVRALTGTLALALVTAFLYGLNFIHTETMAWVSGIIELALVFFSLVCLLAFIKWRQAHAQGRRARAFWCIAFVAFLLAMGSKETAIVLPAWLTLYEWFVGSAGKAPKSKFLFIARTQFPFYAFALIYLFVRASAILEKSAQNSSYTFRAGLTPLSNFVWYTRWTFDEFLYPLNLVKDILLPAVSLGRWVWLALGILLAALALGGIVLWLRARKNVGKFALPPDLNFVLLGLGWFVTGLLPVAFAAIQPAYYLELPVLGAYLALAVPIVGGWRWLRARLQPLAALAALGFVALVTWGAFARVAEMQQTSMARGGPIVRATLERLQDAPILTTGATIYFVDFPAHVWSDSAAQKAIAMYHADARVRVRVVENNPKQYQPQPGDAILRYADGALLLQMVP